MELVKVDEKMRIRLPSRISKRLGLRKRSVLSMAVKGDEIVLALPKGPAARIDPVLRDMIERPLHSKVPITAELLERIEDEMWYP